MLLVRVIVCVLGLAAATSAWAKDGDFKDLYRRGVEQNKKGEFAEAIKFYSRAILLKPDAAPLFFVRGRAYQQNRQYDNSLRDLDKAIALKPNYAEAYNIRGLTNVAMSRKQQALADFKKACSLGLKDACANAR